MSSERQLLNSNDPWWGEHIHRYNEATRYISRHNTVLDIACGTGFGTDILAQHTDGPVIGGDIDTEAIEECRENWRRSNIRFEVMDGTSLVFDNDYFDTIVSFETIEHLTEFKKMITEFFRVLRPGGYLILSTPNATITSPDGIIKNRYHTQEFNSSELKALLGEFFTNFAIYGQRYSRYDDKSIKFVFGKFFEKMFLSFGVRKLPYSFRDSFMKFFFGHTLYPGEKDFVLEKDITIINQYCPVLFVVCKK